MNIANENPSWILGSNLGITILNIKHCKAHLHRDAAEIIFCLEGSVNVTIGARKITLSAGDIFTLDHSDIHCLYSDSDNIVACIHIGLAKNRTHTWESLKHLFFLCSNTEYEHYQVRQLEEVYALLWSALYAFASTRTVYPKSTFDDIANQILDILVKYFSWPYKADLDSENHEDIKHRFQEINKFVQENYMKKITAEEIAKATNLNVNYISHFMKKSSYKSFKNMIAYIRCFNAENMLLTTDLSGQEISEFCGFSSTKYFYKWFRHFFHTSPLQHKNWHKKYASEKETYYKYSPEEMTDIINSLIAKYYTAKILDSRIR